MAEAMQDPAAISFKRSAKSILAAKDPLHMPWPWPIFANPASVRTIPANWRYRDLVRTGGDAENAIRLLNESVSLQDPSSFMMTFDSAFDPLRSDPRFQRLMAEIHPGSD